MGDEPGDGRVRAMVVSGGEAEDCHGAAVENARKLDPLAEELEDRERLGLEPNFRVLLDDGEHCEAAVGDRADDARVCGRHKRPHGRVVAQLANEPVVDGLELFVGGPGENAHVDRVKGNELLLDLLVLLRVRERASEDGRACPRLQLEQPVKAER
eukprot:Amastigsp_a174760_125.p4 type:complete len:156 gc:universal Amastigsp_a174760_125:1877-1410(-)